LWRTLNPTQMNKSEPCGNCLTCGCFHNVYSCDFCSVNHICRSCKQNYSDLCPFSLKQSRFMMDMIDCGPIWELTEDILYEKLRPLYLKYFHVLSNPNYEKIAMEDRHRRCIGARIHYGSTIHADINDCFLPSSVIAFRAMKNSQLHTFLIFGHYEPALNRENMLSYTHLNLRRYRKVSDFIDVYNIRLAMTRGSSTRPMITLDISANAESIPVISQQTCINSYTHTYDSDLKSISLALIVNNNGNLTIRRPILDCLNSYNVMKEMFIARLVKYLNLELPHMLQKHYKTMLELSYSIRTPDKGVFSVSYPIFDDELLITMLQNFELVKYLVEYAVHVSEHFNQQDEIDESCPICADFMSFEQQFEMAYNITKCRRDCEVIFVPSDDLSGLFTVRHVCREGLLIHEIPFKLRMLILTITQSVRVNRGIHQLNNYPSWYADVDQDQGDDLDKLQRLWPLSLNTLWNVIRQKQLKPLNYTVISEEDEDGIAFTEEDEEGIMLIDKPNEYKWLRYVTCVIGPDTDEEIDFYDGPY
ncbi:NSP1, partial [Rotavirus D]